MSKQKLKRIPKYKPERYCEKYTHKTADPPINA